MSTEQMAIELLKEIHRESCEFIKFLAERSNDEELTEAEFDSRIASYHNCLTAVRFFCDHV